MCEPRTVRIGNTEVLLRSRDGRNWHSAPKSMLATERRLKAKGESLKKFWAKVHVSDDYTYGVPNDCDATFRVVL